MPEARQIRNSFNTGEVSPKIEARTDLEKYQNACNTLENFCILPQGGITRRPGTVFVKEAKDSTKAVRIVPFEYSVSDAFILEFGDLYIRFYKNGENVTDLGSPVEVTTPYTEAQLFDLKFAQSADVLFIAHPSHAPRKLSRVSDTNWNLKVLNFKPPPTSEQAVDISGGTISISPSAITGSSIALQSSDNAFLAADVGRTIEFEDGVASITAVTDAQHVTVDFLYDFPADLEPDAMPVGATVTTVGTAATFGADHGLAVGNWVRLTTGLKAGEKRRITLIVDQTHATMASGFSVDQTGEDWSKEYEITGAEGWELGGTPNAQLTPTAVGPVGAVVTLNLLSAGWRSGDVGKYVRGNYGLAKIRTVTLPGATAATAEVMVVFASTTAIPASAWTLEGTDWSTTDGYPATVCFFEQRLFFGGTTAKPTTLWGSATGDYENFNRGSAASDAVVYTIASNIVNTIRWLVPTRALLIGTSGGEFRAVGGTDSPLTPSNVDIKSETTYGSSAVAPVRIGNTVLFVQRAQRKLRDFLYTLQSDGYDSSDLLMLADSISGDGLVDMDYEQEPLSQVWFVREDGVFLSMTYVRGQNVVGWSRHITDGLVESVATIPNPDGLSDQTWIVVNRTIGGATKRYIEYLDWDKVTDCSKSYTGSGVTSCTGLSHLEGETVTVVADGEERSTAVVSGGAITISPGADAIEVGLPYTPKVVTVRPEIAQQNGTIQGLQKRWAECWVRLLDTRGLEINGTPQKDTSLVTKDIRVNMLGADRDGRITIEQSHPYPSTILSIFGTLTVGD